MLFKVRENERPSWQVFKLSFENFHQENNVFGSYPPPTPLSTLAEWVSLNSQINVLFFWVQPVLPINLHGYRADYWREETCKSPHPEENWFSLPEQLLRQQWSLVSQPFPHPSRSFTDLTLYRRTPSAERVHTCNIPIMSRRYCSGTVLPILRLRDMLLMSHLGKDTP